MGVPFITLEGNSMVGRQGVSILHNAGLEEFIAQSKDEYVEKAISLAHNRERLKEFRKSCRSDLLRSPLFNAKQFAEDLEETLISLFGNHFN